MIGFMEAGVLKSMFDLTDADIAKINARLPDLVNLIKVAMAHNAQAKRVVDDLGPILLKILTKEEAL